MTVFKKLFSKLQYKFFIVFLLTSLLPVLVITFFTIDIYVDNLHKQAETNAVFQLRSVDETIYEKVKNIQRFIDVLNANPVISDVMAQPAPDYFSFESAIKSSVASCEVVEGVLFILPTGESYSYNVNISEIDSVRLQVIYNHLDGRPGAISWFDSSNDAYEVGLDDNIMLLGTTYEYKDYYGELKNAKVYIFVDKSMFEDSFKIFNDTSVFITDKNGIIACNNYDVYRDVISLDYGTMNAIYTIDEGVFETADNGQYSITVYTSNSTGFKYFCVDDYEKFYKDTQSIAEIAIFLIILMLTVFVFVYLFISKKITKPIHEMNSIMKNFDNSTLNVRIPVESNDEIGNIVTGFNKMIERINDMILEIENRKDNQKDTEIKALTYQINPHFLYNALSAVRIEAINNGDMKVADSLLSLSKILKSVFSNKDKYISLSDEIDISRSTVNLIQLRYNNTISFKADFSEEFNSYSIPPMVLQPIIENSVLHGLAPKMNIAGFKAKIDVIVQKDDENLIVRIIDNGIGMSDEKITEVLSSEKSKYKGVGIYNVDERIKLLYGDDYGLDIKSLPGIYTEVIMRFKVTN